MIHNQCKRSILVNGLDTWKELFKFAQFPPHTQHDVYNSLIVLLLDYKWTFCFQLWFYVIGSTVGILKIDAGIPLRICLILHLKRLIASEKDIEKRYKNCSESTQICLEGDDNTNTEQPLQLFDIV